MKTVGISSDTTEIASLVDRKEWLDKEQQRRQPCLDLFGEERKACENELAVTENVLSNISNILLFSDVTTLYFEANREDDLRKTGFRKKTATRTRK